MAGSKWQISDQLWERMLQLLLEHKTQHPLSTHLRRVDNRAAMLRTQNGLSVECSEFHRNMFVKLSSPPISGVAGQNGLLACEQLDSIDWSWLLMDGCMTKSPLSGSKKQAGTLQTGKTGGKAYSDGGANGLPLALVVAGANTHDIKLVKSPPPRLYSMGEEGREL